MRTMSLAVNELVTASHAVYASLSERRDDWVQSRDRLHRIGQKRPVTFWNVLVPKSVDEVIYQAHLVRENRSEEHTSELQSLMRISYAVFCLKKKTQSNTNNTQTIQK